MVAKKDASVDSSTSVSAKKPLIIFAITFVMLILISSLVLFSDQFAGQATRGVADTVTVNINGFAFSDAEITIDVGDTVVWANNHGSSHHVQSADATTFNTGVIPAGGRAQFTFNTAGTFEYGCNIHPTMTGLITVRPVACGDNRLGVGEFCDGSLFSADSDTCEKVVGFGSMGTLSCSSDCQTIDSSACSAMVTCGNGDIGADEVCDGSLFPAASDSCVKVMGIGSTGTLSCSSDCQTIINTSCSASSCGNSVLNTGEVCDGSLFPTASDSCAKVRGAGSTGTLSCSSDCQTIIESSCSTSTCGNNVLNTGESCDGTLFPAISDTCEKVVGSGSTGTLSCNSGCQVITSACSGGTCSNGASNPPLCTTCNSTSVLINSTCYNACDNGALNAPYCTTCNSTSTLVGGTCYNNCTNGALDPPTCESCSVNQTLGVGDICFDNCENNATNPPVCNECLRTHRLIDNVCRRDCENNALNPPNCDVCSNGRILKNNECVFPCPNGAIDSPSCVVCGPGRNMVSGICKLTSSCRNGAINSPSCNECDAGKTYYDNQCVVPCSNGGINPPTCSTCQVGQTMLNGICTAEPQQPPPTTSTTGSTLPSSSEQTSLPLQRPPSIQQPQPPAPSFEEYVEKYKVPGFFAGGGLLLVVVIIVIIFVLKGSKLDPQLLNYISGQRSVGVHDDIIKNALIRVGWDEKNIKKGLKRK